MNWSFSALARSCHRRRRGLRLADLEQRPIDLVHRHEGGRHSRGGLEEFAAVHALPAAELVGHRQYPRFHLALPLVLRIGEKFVRRHDLGRDRRLLPA